MGFWIAELIVLAIAITLSFVFYKNIARTIPIAVTILILNLFITGILNLLIVGAWLVIVEGVFSFVFILYKLFHNRINGVEINKKNICNPALAIFLLTSLLFFVIFSSNGYLFCYYDEFSHWGTVIKDIFIHKEICSANANEYLFPNYPPGLALFQWFVMFCNGELSENLAYSAYALCGVSFMLVPFEHGFSYKEIVSCISKLAVVVFVPFLFFSDIWTNLQVDAFLGIIVFGILFLLFNSIDNTNLFDANIISSGLVILTLAKDSGFAIAILLGLGTSIYYFKRTKQDFPMISFIVIIPAVVVKVVWEIFWRLHGTSEIVLQNIVEDYRGDSFYRDIIVAYVQKTLEPFVKIGSIGINIYVVVFTLIGICTLVVFIEEKEQRSKTLFVFILGWSVFFAYTAGILYIYLTLFPYESAVQIPSFQRYESTILVSIALLSLIILIDTLKESGKELLTISSLLIVVLGGLFSTGKVIVKSNDIHQIRQAKRIEDFKYLESINFKEDDLIYVVTQSDSMAYYVANYTIAPANVEPAYIGSRYDSLQYIYSLRETSAGEPSYTAWDISCEEWEQYLKDNQFDYVYLHIVDEYFINTYGELFKNNIKEKCVYKVEIYDGGIVLSEL